MTQNKSGFLDGKKSIFHCAQPSEYQSSEASDLSVRVCHSSSLILHLFFGKGSAFRVFFNDWKRSCI